MDKETIKCMINNSTWNCPEKKVVYKFVSGNIVSVNDKSHLHYSINLHNDKIELQIGSEKIYNIEYVNDFILKLYNANESFRIMPE
jgi:hypothetical protein